MQCPDFPLRPKHNAPFYTKHGPQGPVYSNTLYTLSVTVRGCCVLVVCVCESGTEDFEQATPKMPSLLSRLAELSKPAPSFDPEDDDYDGTAAISRTVHEFAVSYT